MTIETYWKLKADVDAQHIDENGNEYANVLRIVRWRCFAHDGENEISVYGSKNLPLPTNPETYIDLTEITGKSEDERRAIILGWAEMIDPGFVAEKEALAINQLKSKVEAPQSQTLTIL